MYIVKTFDADDTVNHILVIALYYCWRRCIWFWRLQKEGCVCVGVLML